MLTDKQKIKIQSNLVNFRSVLLQNDESLELEPAKFHYELSDLLLKSKDNVAVEMYRESGKSTYVLRAFPLYCLVYPSALRDFIVIVKATQRQASAKLKEIASEYRSNPFLMHNFVEFKEENDKCLSIDVRDSKDNIVNVRIEAYGKGSSLRGLSNQDRRPRVVILDDIQDTEDSRSETVLETDWNWFLSDVKFLGKNSRIFLIGNNLGERCVLERVIKNGESLGFKSIRIPVMIDNVPTWSAQYTLEKILSERDEYVKIGQLNIWFAEKMCQCVSEETKIFKEEDFRYYLESFRDELLKNCNVFACLDPASSIKNTSCYRAIAVVGVDPNNQWFILDMKYGRWDSADMIDVIFSTVREYKLSDFGIEKGHYQQVIEPFLIKEMQKRNVFFNVIPLEHGKIGTKLERIKILQPRFKAHTILMPNYADWLGEFKSELAGVTKDSIKSEYIDLVDALAMIEQVAEAPVNSGQSFRDIVRNELNKGSANQSLFSIAGYR